MVEDPHSAVASVEAEHDEDEPIAAAALRTVASFDRSARSARYDATSAAVAANARLEAYRADRTVPSARPSASASRSAISAAVKRVPTTRSRTVSSFFARRAMGLQPVD